jgi:hypothetical protein
MIRSGGDMKKNTEAQINAANLDLDAFSQGGPAIQAPTTITDRMHALLVTRADALEGCTEGSPEEAELATLTDAIEAYEGVRWPNGMVPGGKA